MEIEVTNIEVRKRRNRKKKKEKKQERGSYRTQYGNDITSPLNLTPSHSILLHTFIKYYHQSTITRR